MIFALIFAAFYCLALLKYHDLVRFAVPYFEDRYLATLPAIGPFDVWQPMGGGYLTLWPRMVSVLLAQFADLTQTPLLLTLYSIALKACASTAIALFLLHFLGMPRWLALLTGLATLVMQTAPFTLDTLLINSMWNMLLIAALALIALPTMRTLPKLLVLFFCVLAISSSIGCVILAVVSVVMLLCALRAKYDASDMAFSSTDVTVYMLIIALVASYVAFGVDYEMLGVSTMLQQPVSFAARMETALIIVFERAFVEGALGRMARDFVQQFSHRQLSAAVGALVLAMALLWSALREFRRGGLRYAGTIFAVMAVTLTLAVMVSYSGRYEDGYGAPQHYYVPAMLVLAAFTSVLAHRSTSLAAAFLIVYLGTAAASWETIRSVAIIGDPRVNHETYMRLAEAFLRGECRTETPCVVDTPPWEGGWAITPSDGH